MLTILDTDLDHTINAAPAEQQQERPEIHITDEAGAKWYARKLATIENERPRPSTGRREAA